MIIKVSKKCCDNNKEFYSYELEENKTIKFVLAGLPNLPIKDISDELKIHNITPNDIKPLKLNNKKYDDHQLYILYFNKGSITLNKLRSIKTICHIVVRWSYYVKSDKITQCYRCQQFGHGTRQCHLSERCVKCSGKHTVDKCPHVPICSVCKKDGHSSRKCPTTTSSFWSASKQTESQIDDFIKCANCGANHTANFKGCQKRLIYIDNRAKINQMKRIPSKPTPQPQQEFDSRQEYPELPHINKNHQFFSQFKPKSSTRPSEPGEQLFSANEIVKITNEIFQQLSTCRSKLEQINVITSIACKYIFNFDG